MRTATLMMLLFMLIHLPAQAGDDLTRVVQQDLQTLGYDPGNTDGELSTETIIAVSTFQAEHDLEVTGEVTPQLAGVIKATINQKEEAASDPAALRAAQEACLQEKIAANEESKKKKRGFGKLLSAVGSTSSRFGGSLGSTIAQTSGTIYGANATASQLESAADDLGLTKDELEECRNP